MTEPTYYSDDQGIRITPTRAIFGKKTYSMANITSISHGTKYQFWGLAVVFILAMFGFSLHWGIGLLIMIVGIVLIFSYPQHTIVIMSAAGEVKALITYDKQKANSILVAFNEALIKRG